MAFKLDFIPNPPQQVVLDDFYFEPEIDIGLMSGGVRAGKTMLGHVLCFTEAQKNDGVDVLVVRSTHDEAVTINADQMFKMFDLDARRYFEENFNKKEGVLSLPNKSRIIFWGLGKPGEDREMYEKIESAGFSFVFIDDARRVPRRVFNYIITRMSGKGSRKILLSTNPPKKNHWLYDEFITKKIPGRKLFLFNTEDNSANLPEDFFRKIYTLPKQWQKVYIEGEWGATYDEDGVFEHEFSIEQHINEAFDYDALKVYRRVVGGLDFGFRHPALVVMAENHNRCVDVFFEKQQANEGIINFFDDSIQEIHEKFHLRANDIVWRGDIAGTQTDSQGMSDFKLLENNFGIRITGQKLGLQSTIFAIQNMLTIMKGGRPVIGFHPRCENLLEGMLGGYRVNEKGILVKDPEFEHILDAWRYGLNEFSAAVIPRRKKAPSLNAPKTMGAPTYFRVRR